MWLFLQGIQETVGQAVQPPDKAAAEEEQRQHGEADLVGGIVNRISSWWDTMNNAASTIIKTTIGSDVEGDTETPHPIFLSSEEQRASLPPDELFREISEAISVVTMRSKEAQKEAEFLLSLSLEEQITHTSDFISCYIWWETQVDQQLVKCKNFLDEYCSLMGYVENSNVSILAEHIQNIREQSANIMAVISTRGQLLREERYDILHSNNVNKQDTTMSLTFPHQRTLASQKHLGINPNNTAESPQQIIHTLGNDIITQNDDASSPKRISIKETHPNASGKKTILEDREKNQHTLFHQHPSAQEKEEICGDKQTFKMHGQFAGRQAPEEEEARRKTLEEEEARRKALEEEARRKALEEEARRKALEEEARRKALEEEARRKALEEEEARRKALEEEEARRKAKEEGEAGVLNEKSRSIGCVNLKILPTDSLGCVVLEECFSSLYHDENVGRVVISRSQQDEFLSIARDVLLSSRDVIDRKGMVADTQCARDRCGIDGNYIKREAEEGVLCRGKSHSSALPRMGSSVKQVAEHQCRKNIDAHLSYSKEFSTPLKDVSSPQRMKESSHTSLAGFSARSCIKVSASPKGLVKQIRLEEDEEDEEWGDW